MKKQKTYKQNNSNTSIQKEETAKQHMEQRARNTLRRQTTHQIHTNGKHK